MGRSGDKLTLTCKTRGQPLIFKKVVKPRKTSTAVSSPMRNRRAALLGKIRMDVPGGSVEDEIKQQSTEIRKATKHKKAKLLEAAGYKISFFVTNKGPRHENSIWSQLYPAQKTKEIFERQRI